MDGQCGLTMVQQRWEASLAQLEARVQWDADESPPLWMQPSPARQHPMDRAASRDLLPESSGTRRAANTPAALEDTVDVAATARSGDPLPWAGAWRIHMACLPREHRALPGSCCMPLCHAMRSSALSGGRRHLCVSGMGAVVQLRRCHICSWSAMLHGMSWIGWLGHVAGHVLLRLHREMRSQFDVTAVGQPY